MTEGTSRVDPSLFPTFLAVVDARRISAAAKALHLSQPAVTAQVRRLEEALGAALFVRSAQGVAPTAAGERLAGYARSVQRLLEEATATLSTSAEPVGALTLAASTTIAAHVLPTVLAAFRARHPRVPLGVDVGNTEAVLAAVATGRTPVGLVEGHARASGVRLEPFVDDEMVAVASASATAGAHGRGRIRTLADLAKAPILYREPGSGTRAVLDRALRKANVRKKPLPMDIELGSNEAILGAVAAGLGVAFVSRWALRAHLAAGRIVTLPGLDFVVRRTFHFALPAGALPSSAAAFVAFAQQNPPVMA